MFVPLNTDTEKIERFLSNLFGFTKQSRDALKRLKDGVKIFEDELRALKPADEKSALWCVLGLLRSDLLTDEKREVLQAFEKDKMLGDVADVMNTKMVSIDTWSWPKEGVVGEQRRQLNGKYRIFHDENLFDSLFLRYVGVKWSVHFQRALTTFREDDTWKPVTRPLSKQIKELREYYLGNMAFGKNLIDKQTRLFEKSFFITQLQRDEHEVGQSYLDDDDDDEIDDTLKIRESPSLTKQTLLHLLSAEIIIKTKLNGELVVLRSDFKSFGPSLAHSTIVTVLKFFGVSARWISFFRNPLEVPRRRSGAKVRVRKRGTPMSSPLADFLARILLFCMDFAVNQATNGSRLYRLHDDFWFWGTEMTCATAWRTMSDFAILMGLEFNSEKTGSQEIFPSGRRPHRTLLDSTLPKGDIRWGFLVLDSKGQFVIDDVMVDEFTNDLRQQLSRCKSILAWIQVYNSFAVRHLTSMFGRPANAFGRGHVDMALNTFSRIHASLFRNKDRKLNLGGGSVEGCLKEKLAKFNLTIPNGFLYFPIDLGGLDVRNHFIHLNQVRDGVRINPAGAMNWFEEKEKKSYHEAKAKFEDGRVEGRKDLQYALSNPHEFFSFKEYTEYREQTSEDLYAVFKDLMKQPEEKAYEMNQRIAACVQLSDWKWEDLTPYHRWAVQTYAQEIIVNFGSLQIIEKDLLPMGMVKALRSRRVKWQE